MKPVFTLILLYFFHAASFASVYNSSGSKSWSASGFPNTVALSDTINILNGDTLTLTAQLSIYGFVQVNSLGVVEGDEKIKIQSTGILDNSGTIAISQEIHVDGSFINIGSSYPKKLHSDGYIYNSGLIKLYADEEFKHHGGELEGCGTILSDNINISENTGVNLNGNSSALTTCQYFCNTLQTDTPVFSGQASEYEFLNNTDSTHSIIDSTITICSPLYLPVKYIDFQATLTENNKINISWTTAIEINNSGFEVERSEDGEHWSFLSYTIGAGNSNSITHYLSTDNSPLANTSYYRLKQIDYDGTITYSEARIVTFTAKVNGKITAFPNPARNKITITSKAIGSNKIIISSLIGEDLTEQTNLYYKTNSDSIEIDISYLKSGIYIIGIGKNQCRFIKE